MSESEDQDAPSAEVESEKSDDRFDGADLCPACLAELTEGCNFCASCAAPVTPLAGWMPFERVFAEAYIYRQAVASPRTLFIVVGAWFVFLPLLATGIIMLLWHWLVEKGDALYVLEGAFITIIGTLGLYHVTQNYLSRHRPGIEPPAADQEASPEQRS